MKVSLATEPGQAELPNYVPHEDNAPEPSIEQRPGATLPEAVAPERVVSSPLVAALRPAGHLMRRSRSRGRTPMALALHAGVTASSYRDGATAFGQMFPKFFVDSY